MSPSWSSAMQSKLFSLPPLLPLTTQSPSSSHSCFLKHVSDHFPLLKIPLHFPIIFWGNPNILPSVCSPFQLPLPTLPLAPSREAFLLFLRHSKFIPSLWSLHLLLLYLECSFHKSLHGSLFTWPKSLLKWQFLGENLPKEALTSPPHSSSALYFIVLIITLNDYLVGDLSILSPLV